MDFGSNDWVALIVGIMAVLSGVYAGLHFVVKAIMAEVGPEANGHSLKQQVNRLERAIERLEARVDAVLLSK